MDSQRGKRGRSPKRGGPNKPVTPRTGNFWDRFRKRARTAGLKVALRGVFVTGAADKSVQDFVIAQGDALVKLLEKKEREEQQREPLRGNRRIARQSSLIGAKTQKVVLNGYFGFLGFLIDTVDRFSDELVKDAPGFVDAIVDIPEQTIRDAIDGVQRVANHFQQGTIDAIESDLRR